MHAETIKVKKWVFHTRNITKSFKNQVKSVSCAWNHTASSLAELHCDIYRLFIQAISHIALSS